MKIRINKILNLIAITLLIVVASFLDPFKENYSTLSLSTKGYFLFLFLGILIGLILSFETYYISNKKYAIIMFLSLLVGTIIPHDISYNLQGNLHLFNAYLGFSIMMIITFVNLYQSIMIKRQNKVPLYIVLIGLFISVYSYMNYLCVNTFSELIIIICVLVSHYLMSKENLKKD